MKLNHIFESHSREVVCLYHMRLGNMVKKSRPDGIVRFQKSTKFIWYEIGYMVENSQPYDVSFKR